TRRAPARAASPAWRTPRSMPWGARTGYASHRNAIAVHPHREHEQRPQPRAVRRASRDVLIDVTLDHVLAEPARERCFRYQGAPHQVRNILFRPARKRHRKALPGSIHEPGWQPGGERLLEDVLVASRRRELVVAGQSRRELDQLVIEKGRAAL